jgi:hypothetical protein
MTDMQISLPLLIVRSSILNSVINFSIHDLWNKMPYVISLPSAFHSIFSNVDATHAPTWSTMIWSTPYHHVTLLVHQSWLHLLFTIASVHRQPVCWAKSCLDLLHLDHMTQCHVSCGMSSFIITCVSFATSPNHFHLHGICCSHTCIYGLITYVSYI